VDLTVYDLAGRIVKRLVESEFRDPGEYTVEWNGRDGNGRSVASGVYVYRLRTEETERTRKMTLVK
jgi:flagellar hook assembly protein FlgD